MISKQSFNRIFLNLLSKQQQQQNKSTFIRLHSYRISILNNKRFFSSNIAWKKPVKNSKFLYVSSFVFGTALGITVSNISGIPNVENDLLAIGSYDDDFVKQRVKTENSIYSEFPFKITLFQYETSPSSSQLRSYLDYFGFSYEIVEVDPITKNELKSISKRVSIPLVILEHTSSKRKWYLTNSVSITSVLETLRNEYDQNSIRFDDPKDIHQLIQKYLPILSVNPKQDQDSLKYKNKYLVDMDKDKMNDIKWRKWVQETAQPVIHWNSTISTESTENLVQTYKIKSLWDEKFNILKKNVLFYKLVFKLRRENKEIKSSIVDLDTNNFDSPNETLNFMIETWVQSLNTTGSSKIGFYNGQNGTNIADLAMFGTMNSYEGSDVFRQAIDNNVEFQFWYKNMKMLTSSSEGGCNQFAIARKNDRNKLLQKTMIEEKLEPEPPLQQIIDEVIDIVMPKNNKESESNIVPLNLVSDDKREELLTLRVLSLTHLIHICLFCFASACKST